VAPAEEAPFLFSRTGLLQSIFLWDVQLPVNCVQFVGVRMSLKNFNCLCVFRKLTRTYVLRSLAADQMPRRLSSRSRGFVSAAAYRRLFSHFSTRSPMLIDVD